MVLHNSFQDGDGFSINMYKDMYMYMYAIPYKCAVCCVV